MKRPTMRRLAGALFAAALVAGCATPAGVERMQVDTSLAMRTAAAASPLQGKVAVNDVTGGSETNPLWVSKVSSGDFARALESSLRDAGLLAADAKAGPYTLAANLQSLEQPFFGLSLTVTATVKYLLIERATGKTVYEQTVVTPHTAQLGDALLGFERLRLANEGAMRANISRLIEELIAIKVPALGLR